MFRISTLKGNGASSDIKEILPIRYGEKKTSFDLIKIYTSIISYVYGNVSEVFCVYQ